MQTPLWVGSESERVTGFMKRIRLLSCLLAALILMSAVPMAGAAQNNESAEATLGVSVAEGTEDAAQAENENATNVKVGAYSSYLKKHKDAKEIDASVQLVKAAVRADKTNSFVMPFSVEEEGFYVLSFDYKYEVAGNKNTTYDTSVFSVVHNQCTQKREFVKMIEILDKS